MSESTFTRWWYSSPPPEPEEPNPETAPDPAPVSEVKTSYFWWSSASQPPPEPPQPQAPAATSSWWPTFASAAQNESEPASSPSAPGQLAPGQLAPGQVVPGQADPKQEQIPQRQAPKRSISPSKTAPLPKTTPQANEPALKPAQESVPPEPSTTSTSWFTWPFFSAPANDSESDVHDKSDLEAFREAKAAIESYKDTCHYAIAGKYGSSDVQLAVSGTRTETRPVSYNHKKKLLVSNEFHERAMTVPRIEPESNPEANGSTKAASSIKSTAANGTDDKPKAANENNYKNLSLPSMDDNFRVVTVQTKLRLYSEALFHGDQTSEKHLYKSTLPSIKRKRRRYAKKAVVISVHSFLPTKFVKSAIGQTTGSALLFNKHAMEAVYKWASADPANHIEITSLSLEGLGKIDSRVDKSYALLQNWQQQINAADFVFVAANSVASPVAVNLLHKMISGKDFDFSGKKVGLLSISGTFLGSFRGLDTKVVRRAYTQTEYEILSELFELEKMRTPLAISIFENIGSLCQANVKITLAGSVNDQFVPVYSAVGHCIRHPNIYKCVYVDEKSEAPGFIVKLLAIMLTMENVGYRDHNIINEISDFVQGPISSSGSHGKIITAATVYDAGVQFALESTSLKHGKPPKVQPRTAGTEGERNPFDLPWNIRGLVNDLLQIRHIGSLSLIKELLREYRAWEPTTRPMRELKMCFAAFEEVTPDDVIL